MKDNRFSLATNQRMTAFASNKSNSNFASNMKSQNLNEAKNRKSTNQMIVPRSTTFSLSKSSDPRPITEQYFKDECITKILDFLIKEAYEKSVSRKYLFSPQTKDFISIFTFILSKIRPDWNPVISKLEEDIIYILNELRYPGHINKSHLAAVGAPNTWPYLLAVLAWMVELANYLYFSTMSTQASSQEEEVPYSKSQIEKFDELYKSFIYEGYKQTQSKGDLFGAIETFQKKTDEMINHNFSNADKISKDIAEINNMHQELINNTPQVDNVKNNLEQKKKEVNSLKSQLAINNKNINDANALIQNKSQLYDTKCQKNRDMAKTLEEVESIVKSQKVSFDEFEKMKITKGNYEKTLQLLSSKKQELTDILWNLNNSNTKLCSVLHEKAKNIAIASDRIAINTITSIDIPQHIQSCTEQAIVANIPVQFSQSNELLEKEIQAKSEENTKRQDVLISLQSELLKLDDKIHEGNEILTQREIEYQREESNTKANKESFAQLLMMKNDEINKLNDNYQKGTAAVKDKEKEMESLKVQEANLQVKLAEKEEQVDRYTRDLDSLYFDTIKEVEAIKIENIRAIRHHYKSMASVFQSLKQHLN